jgi:hypothetical protein
METVEPRNGPVEPKRPEAETPLEKAQKAVAARTSRQKRRMILAITGTCVMVVAAAVVLLLAFVVLPQDTATARELMSKSDSAVLSTRPTGEKISASVNIMLPDISILTSQQYSITAENIRALTDEARANLSKARKGYLDILNLKGVGSYKEYAQTKLDLIDVDMRQLTLVDDYLDYLGKELASHEAGAALNPEALATATNESNKKLSELGDRMDGLTKQAEELKKEKSL